MVTKIAVHARWLLTLALACCLLVSGQGSAQAAASDKDIARINSVFRALAVAGVVQPIDAAIWEANAIDCLNKNPNLDATSCALRQVPQVLAPAIAIYSQVRFSLPGAWATRDTYPGLGASDGSMIIDNKNVGTLTSGRGAATLIFSKYDNPDDGNTYAVFAYRTSQGDRGSGALLFSDDGCLMYGGYHSTSDPTTIGNFFAARC